MNFKEWLLTENYEPQFLMSILRNPKDLTNYLVYADWLEDNKNTDTDNAMIAQFIRAVIERKTNPKGRLRQLNDMIAISLPEVRRVTSFYSYWTDLLVDDNRIEMFGVSTDKNQMYYFYLHDYTFQFQRSTWGDEWVTVHVPGSVIIASPRQNRVAAGDQEGMEELRQQAEQWEVPYLGNIIRNPPRSLLLAMALGNLYKGIPPHIRRRR